MPAASFIQDFSDKIGFLPFADYTWLANELNDSVFFASRFSEKHLQYAPSVASFFAGCGGLDLGFQWAGYNVLYANERDSAASCTYATNFRHGIQNKPIEEVDIDAMPDHDCLIGGFPCQPFSHAGKRGGLADARGTLFYYLALCLKAKKPKVFLFENVKGLLTHEQGRTLHYIRNILKEQGYNVSYALLNAKNFYVPQERERLFLAGVRSDAAPGKYIEFPEGFRTNISVKSAINDLVGRSDVPNNEPMRHSSRVRERYKHIPEGGSLRDAPEEHQQRRRGAPLQISGKLSTQSYRRMNGSKPSPTICAMFQAHFIHYSEDRNLTAREAARIQTFPDDFVFCGKRVNMSWDTELSQYQQIGNAVPPKVGYALARTIYTQCFA